jgi:carbonic anhydrase
MKKLIKGIVRFRQTRRRGLARVFGTLALGQKPDALFITCSDSRVAANVFASTDPGDLFMVRNVGNLAPPHGRPEGVGTVAAVNFALDTLRVKDIIVCGHSDCGAIGALRGGRGALPAGPLRRWLGQAGFRAQKNLDADEASRRNVLTQLDHLRRYPRVQAAAPLGLHGMWFDIRRLNVWYYEGGSRQWVLLDAREGQRILNQLGR